MLIELLQGVTDRIEAIDPRAAGPEMLAQINRHRRQVLDGIFAKAGGARTKDVEEQFAIGVVRTIKRIPEIIERLVEPLERRSHDGGTRCAVATVLAYIVQPRDLIPDDSPGGYGYIDDYVLARAALVEFLIDIEHSRQKTPVSVEMMFDLLPVGVAGQMEQAVQGLSMAYQVMRSLPPFVVDMMVEQIVANPLAAAQAPMPSPTAFHAAPSVQQGFWGRSGAYVEGNDIIIPGGPSLIGGQLFIPD